MSTTQTVARRIRPARANRALSVAAAGSGSVYLGWRAFAADGGSAWVNLAMLGLEIWGFALLVGLLFRAWPRSLPPSEPAGAGTGPARSQETPIDVVVTAGVCDRAQLEQTLLACEALDRPLWVHVIDRRHRPELAALCDEFGAGYRTDGGSTGADSLLVVAESVGLGPLLWLDGGDIPLPGVIEAGLAAMSDPATAVVQVSRQLQNTDAFVNLRRGGDPEAIEESITGPSLGARGVAPWLGSGSFVRCEALLATDRWPDGHPAALHRATIQLNARGWRTVHEPRPLVGVRAPDTLDEYLGYRRRRALAGYRLLVSRDNPLLVRRLGPRSRIAHLTDALGQTAGLRQLGVVGLVIAVLVTGRLPFAASLSELATWWVPAWTLGTLARLRACGGILRLGDATRNAWRGVGAELSAIRAIAGRPTAPARRRAGPSLARLRAPVAAAVALNLAIVTRGITVAFDDLLPAFSTTARIVVVAVALVTLVPILDVLQLTVRRKQRRRTHRISVDFPVTLGGQRGRALDLTVDGIGVAGVTCEVGVTRAVDLTLPMAGDQRVLRVQAIVRSSIQTPSGPRTGFEFVGLSAEDRRLLVTFCLAEARRTHGQRQRHSIGAVDLAPSPPLRRLVRSLSMLGVGVGVVTMLAGPASADPMTTASACLVDSTGAPVAGAEVSYDHGRRRPLGSTGADGCVRGQVPARVLTFEVAHRGIRDSKRLDTRVDTDVQFQTTKVTVSLVDSTGAGVADAVVSYFGGQWRRLGTTDPSGVVTAELLADEIRFNLNHRGIDNPVDQDIGLDPTVELRTERVTVRLLDSTGAGLADGVVSYHAGYWRRLGVTDSTGTVTAELLADEIRFALGYRGIDNAVHQDIRLDPTVEFRTRKVTVSLLDSTGSGLADGVVSYHGGQWRPFGVTDESGIVTAELLPDDIRFDVSHRGIDNSVQQDIGLDPTVEFRTRKVTVSLLDSTGAGLADGVVTYYGGYWRQLGVTDRFGIVTGELLPDEIRFEISHRGIDGSTRHDTGRDPGVVFQTGAVVGEYPGRVERYRGERWRSFTEGIELLPASILFSLDDNTMATATPVAGETIVVPGGSIVQQTNSTSTASTASTVGPTTSAPSSTRSTLPSTTSAPSMPSTTSAPSSTTLASTASAPSSTRSTLAPTTSAPSMPSTTSAPSTAEPTTTTLARPITSAIVTARGDRADGATPAPGPAGDDSEDDESSRSGAVGTAAESAIASSPPPVDSRDPGSGSSGAIGPADDVDGPVERGTAAPPDPDREAGRSTIEAPDPSIDGRPAPQSDHEVAAGAARPSSAPGRERVIAADRLLGLTVFLLTAWAVGASVLVLILHQELASTFRRVDPQRASR